MLLLLAFTTFGIIPFLGSHPKNKSIYGESRIRTCDPEVSGQTLSRRPRSTTPASLPYSLILFSQLFSLISFNISTLVYQTKLTSQESPTCLAQSGGEAGPDYAFRLRQVKFFSSKKLCLNHFSNISLMPQPSPRLLKLYNQSIPMVDKVLWIICFLYYYVPIIFG